MIKKSEVFMKKTVFKRILPILLTTVIFLSAIIPTFAASISAPTEEEPYYSVVFEDGVLTLRLNPDKICEVLRDGELTRAELKNFVPEDVLTTLTEEELTPETLIRLAANYFTVDDLIALKNMVPVEVFYEYFDLEMLSEVITIDELLDLVSLDEILADISDDELFALVNDEAFRILLNEKAKNEVLTDDFITDILQADGNRDKIDALVEEKHDKLMELVTNEVVDKLFDDPAYADEVDALVLLVEKKETLDKVLDDDETVTKIKNYLTSHDDLAEDLDRLEHDSEAVKNLRNSAVIREFVNDYVHHLVDDININLSDFASDFNITYTTLTENNNAAEIGLTVDLVRPYVTISNPKVLFDNNIVDTAAISAVYPQITVDNLRDNAAALGIDADELNIHSTVEDLVGAIDDYDAFCNIYGITTDSLKNNATALGITTEELINYVDIPSLIADLLHGDKLNIEKLCEIYDVTVDKLIDKQYITNSDIADIVSDNWKAALDQGLAKEIVRCIGLHSLFEDFGRDEIINAIGGYKYMMTKNFVSETDVLDTIGGYETIIDLFIKYFPEKLDTLIDLVGYDKWKDFVDFSDVVDRAGGYDVLVSWYSLTELSDAAKAIGIRNIVDFLEGSGIREKIDAKGIAKDFYSLIISKKSEIKSFAKTFANKISQIVTNEISFMYLNGTQIYKYGEFDLQAIVTAILQAIPDLDTFLAMQDGDVFTQLVLSTDIRGKEFKFGVAIEFIGDLTRLQDLVRSRADFFRIDVSDELDVVTEFVVPEIASELYCRALLSNKVPERIKAKILELPTMTVSDMNDILKGITREEIETYSSEVFEKIDEIKQKVYGKIEAKFGNDNAKIESAKAKADEILDIVSDPDKLCALRDKAIAAVDKVAAKAGDKKLSYLYDGESVFSFDGSFSFDFYKLITRFVNIPDELYVVFGNDLTLSGSVDMTVTVNGLYKASVIDADGTVHEYFLPEGLPLSKLNSLADLDYEFTNEKMPAKDTSFIYKDLYVIEFYRENGTLLKSFTYTEDNIPTAIPTVPAKRGYTAKWQTYEFCSSQLIKVYPEYTAIETKPSYTFQGNTIPLEFDVSVETKEVVLPELTVPGYGLDTFFVDVNNNHVFDEGEDFYLTYDSVNKKYIVPDGYSFPAVDKDKGEFVHLVPVFDPYKYSVSYVINGESFPLEDKHVTVETREVSLPDLTYTGHTFVGWYADLNKNGIVDGDDFLLTKAPSNLNLRRAVVVGNDATFVISDENDSFPALDEGSDISFIPAFDVDHYSVTFMNGTTQYAKTDFTVLNQRVSFPENPTPAPGYRFIGWYLDGNGDGDTDDAEDIKVDNAYVPELEDITVYAKYELIPKSSATFYSGTTVYHKVTFTDEQIAAGFVVDLPMYNPTPATGYRFIGWYLDVNGDGDGDDAEDTKITASFVPDITKEYKIYARYEIIPTSTATFYKGNTVYKQVIFTDEQIADGFVVTLPDTTPTPATGYRFIGWYLDGNGDGDGDDAEDIKITASFVPDITKEYKIYARFEFIPRFSVTFMNGTTQYGEKVSFTDEDVAAGIKVNLPATNPTPADGYRFLGWYLDANGDGDVDDAEDILLTAPFAPTASNITVYAKYELIPVYTVTFVAGTEVVDTITFREGATSLSRAPLAVPPKPGYNGAWPTVTLENKDITVTAVYTPIKYTATFIADNFKHEITFTVEDTELQNVPAVPEKVGYKNGRWSSYTLGARDITITAEYDIITYKAYFVANEKVVATVDFTVLDTSISEPAVPSVDGYIGKWEAYTLGANDITIKAVYTPAADTDTDSDTSVDSGDDTDAPITIVDDDDGNNFIIWIILLILIIILIIIWIISKKKNDDDEPKNDPPAVVAPEPEPKPEPEVEEVTPEPIHIETVETVDVETADLLMTDEVAATVVETVGGAGVGTKAIINVSDINNAFASGDVVDIDALKAKKLIPANAKRIKVLADGHLDISITVYAEQFSVQAVKMITLTGGKAIQKK